jgi:hypothetical protein
MAGLLVKFKFGGKVANTLPAHRVIQHFQEKRGEETADKIISSLYRQYFEEEKHPSEEEIPLRACKEAGIKEKEAKEIIDDESEELMEVKSLILEQASNGVDSVQYIVVEGKRRDVTLVGAKELDEYVKALEQIVKESYAQMRKFNCWNISIVQQYGRFKESRIRSAVFGNSRQFFLMRQNDRADLDDMAADIGLTELTKHAILSYPLPDQQKGEKFSAFTYLHNDAQNPICGTAHNVASPEMIYLSGSSGAQFDQRAQRLRATEDVLSAIESAIPEQ